MNNNYGLRKRATHHELQNAIRHHRHLNKNIGVHQLNQAKDRLEAYNTKTRKISFRKQLLDDQTKTKLFS